VSSAVAVPYKKNWRKAEYLSKIQKESIPVIITKPEITVQSPTKVLSCTSVRWGAAVLRYFIPTPNCKRSDASKHSHVAQRCRCHLLCSHAERKKQ
jgi:hypothetical protein